MKWKGFGSIKKEQAAVIFIVGVLLMVITLPVKEKENSQQDQKASQTQEEQDKDGTKTDAAAYTEYLEKRLEECLSQMKGAGKVQVFITMRSSAEQVVAKDKSSTKHVQGEEESGEETDSENTEQTVYQETGEESVPYVVKELSPAIKGVLVVAEGGDDPVVRQDISDAVMALFSIESHKIKIVRMKEG